MEMKKDHGLRLPWIVMIISVIIAVITISIGLTAAYLTDRDDEINVLKEGETVIEIAETFSPDPDPEPGDAAVKVVRITNTGNLTCTIRARLVFTDDALEKITQQLEIGEGWTEGADGFYYYLRPVDPGETTKPLIERVVFRRFYEDGTPVTAQELGKIDAGLMVYSEALEFVRDEAGEPTAEEVIRNWSGY